MVTLKNDEVFIVNKFGVKVFILFLCLSILAGAASGCLFGNKGKVYKYDYKDENPFKDNKGNGPGLDGDFK
jgi:hypothetical protein